MANANMCLEAARKAFPDNEELRVAYMIGFNEGFDRAMEQPDVDLEKASRNVYESWMGGTMDDVRLDMVELGKVLNARKEE